MQKGQFLFLLLLLFMGCNNEKTTNNNSAGFSNGKPGAMNFLKEKWNQLPKRIQDSSYVSVFDRPEIDIDSNGDFYSVDDEMSEVYFDSIGKSIKYDADLTYYVMWSEEYRGNEVIFFLGSSMANLKYSENFIKCYQNNEGKIIEITEAVYPFEFVKSKLCNSANIADTIISQLDRTLCSLIARNKDNSLRIHRNNLYIEQISGVELGKDSEMLHLKWSGSNGYILK